MSNSLKTLKLTVEGRKILKNITVKLNTNYRKLIKVKYGSMDNSVCRERNIISPACFSNQNKEDVVARE